MTGFTEKDMRRSRYVYDRELECLIEVTEGTNYDHESKKLLAPKGVIRDLDNYPAVGIRDETRGPGHALVITKGRRQHRDELRARGLMEVGNERAAYADKPQMPDARSAVREAMARTGFFDGARSIRELRRQQGR